LFFEARAEIQKYFRSFFGSNENFKICFQDVLTFTTSPLSRRHSFWTPPPAALTKKKKEKEKQELRTDG
jgi:hypothetical protein